MIIVSDTSCLCYLARLGCESVLERLFGAVLIPPAVGAELMAGSATHPEIDRVLHAPWLTIHTLESDGSLDSIPDSLDRGEAEAIFLALQMKADHLLIDEKIGRKFAESLKIPIVGLLGVLGRARATKLIGPLRPLIVTLVNELGFRANPLLIEELLKQHGE